MGSESRRDHPDFWMSIRDPGDHSSRKSKRFLASLVDSIEFSWMLASLVGAIEPGESCAKLHRFATGLTGLTLDLYLAVSLKSESRSDHPVFWIGVGDPGDHSSRKSK